MKTPLQQHIETNPFEVFALLTVFPAARPDPTWGHIDLQNGFFLTLQPYTTTTRCIGGDRKVERMGWKIEAETRRSATRWEPEEIDAHVVDTIEGDLGQTAIIVDAMIRKAALQDSMLCEYMAKDCHTCQGTGYRNPLDRKPLPCKHCQGTGLGPQHVAKLNSFQPVTE